MGRPARLSPRELGVNWPDAVSADPVAEVARQFALNLRAVTDDIGLRETARRTNVDVSVVSRVLSGDSWPDFVTIARLELGLGIDLWPRQSA